MTDNALTGAQAAAEGAPASNEGDNVQVQTTATEQEAREARVAAVQAEKAPAAEAEKPAETADDEKPKAPGKIPEWAQKRFDNIAYEAREAARRAKQLETENEALRAQMRRAPAADPAQATTQGDAAAAAGDGPAPGTQFAGYRSQEEFDRAVEAKTAERLATQERARYEAQFTADCNATYAKGKAEFVDFDGAMGNLRTMGMMNPALIEAALATDEPAKVLYNLGSDPDNAARIMSLNPAKMIAELTKMAVAGSAAPAQKRISNAPAPVKPVEGTARASSDPRDDDDDKTWFAKRETQKRERMAR